MAKFWFTLNIGMMGEQEEEYEIPDEILEGLEGDARHEFIQEQWQEWTYNYIDGGWNEMEPTQQ